MLKKKKSVRLAKTLIEKRKARTLKKKTIIDDIRLGCSASESARRQNICEGTLRQWQFYDKQFCAQLKSGRLQGIRHMKKCLLIELQSGKSIQDAVGDVGLSVSTIRNWRKRDPRFHSAVNSALGKK